MRLDLNRSQLRAHRALYRFKLTLGRLDSSITCLERMDSFCTSLGASIDSFHMSGSASEKLTEALHSLDSSADKILQSSDEILIDFRQVEGLVTRVQEQDWKIGQILRCVYIDEMSIDEISDSMKISKRQVYNLLKKGLDMAFKFLESDSNEERGIS